MEANHFTGRRTQVWSHFGFHSLLCPERATWRNQYEKDGLVVSGDREIPLTGAGTAKGESGIPWKGYDPATSGRGRHWAVPKTGTYAKWLDANLIPGYLDIEGVRARLDALEEKGLIRFSKNGIPNLFRPAEAANTGPKVNDIWTDISLEDSNEFIKDYPTRKPVKLVERIIQASLPKDGIIFDPFCGCGTTIEAAHNLGCNWVGIDISPYAINLIERHRMKGISLEVKGVPKDLLGAKRLASDNPFDFEEWAVCRIPGLAPNDKQVGDGGIDGRGILLERPGNYDSKLVLAQVKGGKHNASALRDFLGVIDSNRAAMGVYITLSSIKSHNAHSAIGEKGKIRYGMSEFLVPSCGRLKITLRINYPSCPRSRILTRERKCSRGYSKTPWCYNHFSDSAIMVTIADPSAAASAIRPLFCIVIVHVFTFSKSSRLARCFISDSSTATL